MHTNLEDGFKLSSGRKRSTEGYRYGDLVRKSRNSFIYEDERGFQEPMRNRKVDIYREYHRYPSFRMLRRFLHSKIGVPWNLVYHDLCRELSRKLRLEMGLDNYLARMVRQDVLESAGEIVEVSTGHPVYRSRRGFYDAFYVDGDGILREIPRSGSKVYGNDYTRRSYLMNLSRLGIEMPSIMQNEQYDDGMLMSDGSFVLKVRGIWYRYVKKDAPSPPQWWLYSTPEARDRVSWDRKQLSKKELKMMGLSNAG